MRVCGLPGLVVEALAQQLDHITAGDHLLAQPGHGSPGIARPSRIVDHGDAARRSSVSNGNGLAACGKVQAPAAGGHLVSGQVPELRTEPARIQPIHSEANNSLRAGQYSSILSIVPVSGAIEIQTLVSLDFAFIVRTMSFKVIKPSLTSGVSSSSVSAN